jgi:hypothetical protein
MTQRRKRTEAEKQRIRALIKRYAEYGYRFRQDVNYASVPAKNGDYIIVLKIGDREFRKPVSILDDHWFETR